MAVISTNFNVIQGDTYVESWALLDQSGVAVDLTGAKLYFTVKTAYADADPGVLQLTSPSSGITIDSAAGGLATLTITSTQSGALTVGTYKYDVQLKDSAGTIKTLVSGTLTVDAQVTITTA